MAVNQPKEQARSG